MASRKAIWKALDGNSAFTSLLLPHRSRVAIPQVGPVPAKSPVKTGRGTRLSELRDPDEYNWMCLDRFPALNMGLIFLPTISYTHGSLNSLTGV